MNENTDFRRILGLLATDDPAAADEIDALADRLRALAAGIRARARCPFTDDGGTADKVRMRVVRPDGTVRQEIEVQG